MKKHILVLIGNELYFFRSHKDKSHKIMHCLTGTYLKEVGDGGHSDSNSDISASVKSRQTNETNPSKVGEN